MQCVAILKSFYSPTWHILSTVQIRLFSEYLSHQIVFVNNIHLNWWNWIKIQMASVGKVSWLKQTSNIKYITAFNIAQSLRTRISFLKWQAWQIFLCLLRDCYMTFYVPQTILACQARWDGISRESHSRDPGITPGIPCLKIPKAHFPHHSPYPWPVSQILISSYSPCKHTAPAKNKCVVFQLYAL